MYLIKTWDKSEIVVSDKDGEQIKKILNTNVQFIGINGSMYAKSAISQITRYDEVMQYDLILDEHQITESSKDYRGIPSSAKETIRKAIKSGNLKSLKKD